MKRSWKRNWIVLAAIIVHGIWGLVLLVSKAPMHTTPLGAIHRMPILQHQLAAATLYLSASVIAAVPVVCRKLNTAFVGLLCSGPQQFLLMVSFFTGCWCIIIGAYPDGYVPDKHGSPRLFIFVDQLWPMVGMWCHTFSI